MLKKIKRLFCKHKNAVEIDRESFILNGMEKVCYVTYQCPDCDKTFVKRVR